MTIMPFIPTDNSFLSVNAYVKSESIFPLKEENYKYYNLKKLYTFCKLS